MSSPSKKKSWSLVLQWACHCYARGMYIWFITCSHIVCSIHEVLLFYFFHFRDIINCAHTADVLWTPRSYIVRVLREGAFQQLWLFSLNVKSLNLRGLNPSRAAIASPEEGFQGQRQHAWPLVGLRILFPKVCLLFYSPIPRIFLSKL